MLQGTSSWTNWPNFFKHSCSMVHSSVVREKKYLMIIHFDIFLVTFHKNIKWHLIRTALQIYLFSFHFCLCGKVTESVFISSSDAALSGALSYTGRLIRLCLTEIMLGSLVCLMTRGQLQIPSSIGGLKTLRTQFFPDNTYKTPIS